MKTGRYILGFTILVLGLSGCGLTGSTDTGTTPTDPIAAVSAANQVVRDNVRFAMQQAAERFGMPVQLDSFEFISRDDFSVASALIAGFDQPLGLIDDSNRVADLGLVYLDVPAALGIPRGFYKVRAYILQSRADLLNEAGQPVVALPLERFSLVGGSNKPMIINSGCDVMFIYNQPRQTSPNLTIEVSVRVDWCAKLIGR